jgi:hypothetical protein
MQEGEMFSEMSIRYAAEMQRDHHQEMLRAAQVDRELRQAWPRSSWRISVDLESVLWLGRWLVNWASVSNSVLARQLAYLEPQLCFFRTNSCRLEFRD